MSPEPVTITATDGVQLRGSLYAAPAADTTVIVHGATAVPQRFYRRFAAFMQAKGWAVLTYDYRGIGDSAPPSLVGFDAKASDWGLLDMPAVLDWTRQNLRPRRIFFVGHSAGGQQAGLLDRADAVTAMVTASSQSGYWALQGGLQKLNVLLLTTLALPTVARLVGYFPWSRFGAGEDLPKAAAIEWARWCRSPRYLFRDTTLPLHRYASFRAPILAYSIDDDNWGTARSVDVMMGAYPNVERRHLVAAEYGMSALGHMGFFRAGSEAIWDEVYDWLRKH